MDFTAEEIQVVDQRSLRESIFIDILHRRVQRHHDVIGVGREGSCEDLVYPYVVQNNLSCRGSEGKCWDGGHRDV